MFLGLCALPLTFGLLLLDRPAREISYLAGPLAWLALRAAGAIRNSGDRPFGALGPIFVEGMIVSLGAAVLPWTTWLLAAASPAAFLMARTAERRFSPSLWAERRHLSAGDPLSWGAS